MECIKIGVARETLLQRLRRYYISQGMKMISVGKSGGFVVVKDEKIIESFKDAQLQARTKQLIKHYEYEL